MAVPQTAPRHGAPDSPGAPRKWLWDARADTCRQALGWWKKSIPHNPWKAAFLFRIRSGTHAVFLNSDRERELFTADCPEACGCSTFLKKKKNPPGPSLRSSPLTASFECLSTFFKETRYK